MIRLAWRQFRAPASVAFAALAVVVVLLAITGPALVHLYDTTVATCQANGDCAAATSALLDQHRHIPQLLDVLLLAVPGLIGIFWGAPLVAREMEAGTYRLAWTQSVTRTRWLAVKFGVGALASMATAGLLSLAVTWWASPIDTVNANRFSHLMFDERNIAPVGYAAFAFALGVTAGVVIRRALPAMALTLAAFVGARLAIATWILPRLEAPVHTSVAFGSATGGVGIALTPSGPIAVAPSVGIPNAWVYSSRVVADRGNGSMAQFLKSACPTIGKGLGAAGPGPGHSDAGPAPAAGQECMAKIQADFHVLVTYQPASRYWAFQTYDTAIFVVLAALLGGVAWWWIRQRAS